MKNEKYGEWAFLLGVILALIIGLFSTQISEQNPDYLIYLTGVLAVLGLIVGILNIREKETTTFLIAAITLIAVSTSWGPITSMLETVLGPTLGDDVSIISELFARFFSALLAFVSPAALIIALKAIYDLATKQ